MAGSSNGSEEQTITYNCSECDEYVVTAYGDEWKGDEGELVCKGCRFPIWVPVRAAVEEMKMDELESEATKALDRVSPHHWATSEEIGEVWCKIGQDGTIFGPYDEVNGEILTFD